MTELAEIQTVSDSHVSNKVAGLWLMNRAILVFRHFIRPSSNIQDGKVPSH